MKFYNLLYRLSYKLKQQAMYYELKSHIEDHCYIKSVSTHDRQIGKTYTLVKLSKKYNIPVLEPNAKEKRMLQMEYPNVFVISPQDLRGKQVKYTTLLIDDKQRISEDMVKYIDIYFRQIGFTVNSYL